MVISGAVLGIFLLSHNLQAPVPYIEITSTKAVLLTAPTTASSAVATLLRGDLFQLEGSEGDYYVIIAISGEARYVAKRYARTHHIRPAVSASAQAIARAAAALDAAESRATKDA